MQHLSHRPLFSNREFEKVGIAVRDAGGEYDWGRYDGIKALLASRFNLLSGYNDDKAQSNSTSTRHVALTLEAYGAFKVPSLRNVALTPPYMHNGLLNSLTDVVRHYSEINAVKLHIAASHPHVEPGEALPPRRLESAVRTLDLAEQEVSDLVSFIESLTESSPNLPPIRRSRRVSCR